MGLFFYTKKGSIISTVDLPTTEIIEPIILKSSSLFFVYWYRRKLSAYIEVVGLLEKCK
jgi:hypothetical protein